jgi:ribonuclease HI
MATGLRPFDPDPKAAWSSFNARLAEAFAYLGPLAEPPKGKCLLTTDGASKGNPGPAGAGAALYGPDEAELGRWAFSLGLMTNNAAEYAGLILGLTTAKALGVSRLSVKMDSELVARQMLGQYKVRSEGLFPFYERAKKLAKGFEEIVFAHVYRERNHEADRLASRAAEAFAKGRLGAFEEMDLGGG